jgi:ParB-like chromosome segregation protein Spo0J
MEIIKIPLEQLTPDPHNAKDHPQWQIEQIKNSIEQFGNLDPIGVWGDNNLIVEGHGRYEALKDLGYHEAECIRLDWLTEEERKAYALAHNKLTMNSGFIPDALDMNLDAIQEIDMSLFGFDKSVVNPEASEDDYDGDDDEKVPPRAKRGEIYQLGEHRLMCGDSSSADDLDSLMGGGTRKHGFYRPTLWCFNRRQEQNAE